MSFWLPIAFAVFFVVSLFGVLNRIAEATERTAELLDDVRFHLSEIRHRIESRIPDPDDFEP